jgi:LysR family glycine cleavage system transcriptional activator
MPTFRAVAERANLRAAAQALHLTHSAVSQQIRALEDQLGFPLFDRRGRRVVLNEAGAALLPAVQAALDGLVDGVALARAAAGGIGHTLRLSTLPSFAQRWLLPRMARWRARHPALALELHTSQDLVDLARDGYDAAVRQGLGPWRGLQAEPLFDSPLIAVGAPAAADRVHGRGAAALADEPLLGDAALWARWFRLDGDAPRSVRPVASFNDAGLMLQAAEQGLGIALARDLLAADALHEGRLRQLSPLALPDRSAQPLWLVYPARLAQSPALEALRDWLHDELALSRRQLDLPAGRALTEPAPGTASAGPTGSRSRARLAARRPGHDR